MYKVEYDYSKKCISIYKNVSPFAGGKPLWDTFGVYYSANDIPDSLFIILGEDEIDGIFWFFEDVK